MNTRRKIDVLVTGAAGVLGATLVQELRRRGKNVIGTARQQLESIDQAWDIATPYGPVLTLPVETIIHVAAKRAPIDVNRRDEVLWDINVGGTARVVEWALQTHVKRVILISEALVYGDWSQPRKETDDPNPAQAGYFALSKWAAERIAAKACKNHCELTILRLSSLYGAAYNTGLIRHFLSQAMADGRIRVDPPMDDAFDLLHLADAARTVANSVDHPCAGLWNIGGGAVTSLTHLAEACAVVTGASVEKSRRKARRRARILNWVDDRRARSDLQHSNSFLLLDAVGQMTERSRREPLD